jgi:hypothetical protein
MKKFKDNELVILNENVKYGLPNRVGELVTIYCIHANSTNYDYTVELDNGDINPVKESELNKLTDLEIELSKYIFKGNEVFYNPTGEVVTIVKTDYLHHQAEVETKNKVHMVIGFHTLRELVKEFDILKESEQEKLGYFAELGLEVGKLVDEKQKAYGDSVSKAYEIMKVLLKDYHNEENHTYTIPESLLEIMLLDVRKIDKLNRRFSNPDGDLMGENPFKDDVGYSLLGMRMVEHIKNK